MNWTVSVLTALYAIVPLTLGMLFLQRVILRSRQGLHARLFVGLLLSVCGYVVFVQGLNTGLVPLGTQVGSSLLAATTDPHGHISIGGLLILFSVLIGYGATVAEPALIAMGIEVEQITYGACRRTWLIHTVGAGVAVGVAAGMVMTVLALPLIWFVVPAYGLLLIIAHFGSDRFNNIAWDAAGVTTGPITVPMVLALGLGVAPAPLHQAFGILALASAGPILMVSLMGLLIEYAQSSGGKHGRT
jgi:hypothetical protein